MNSGFPSLRSGSEPGSKDGHALLAASYRRIGPEDETLKKNIILLTVMISTLIFSQAAYALEPVAEKAIKKYLKLQGSKHEYTESQGIAVSDLNGDGKSEIVLVWTLLGPTYWRNTLTIFTETPKGYKPVSSLELEGEAHLSSVKNGIINIEQKTYGEDDPRCCPSIKKQIKYRWQGNKILKLKE